MYGISDKLTRALISHLDHEQPTSLLGALEDAHESVTDRAADDPTGETYKSILSAIDRAYTSILSALAGQERGENFITYTKRIGQAITRLRALSL